MTGCCRGEPPLGCFVLSPHHHIGRNAMYKLLASGDLKAFRVDRNWKIPRKEVDAYIDKMVK